ncbi:hypothetical protein [Rhizobium sp. 1399]|uniref:hypothetical protein n=1 Tax=Rhizobium sp. 1399 TaxID=2817758 RepID=UPI00285D9DA4|nr:hypothetical protein [Rhizobium sp. 1399]MDR6670209.1 hypothetical protein [Rhizobium sp. 1399]
MSSLFRYLTPSIATIVLACTMAGPLSSAELSSATVDRVLDAGRWSPTADDREKGERLPTDFVQQLVSSYPADTRSIGLLSLALGAGKWGIEGDMSGLADPAGDNWQGPTRGSGKHLMSYLVGGVGLPHLDRAQLATFIDYIVAQHSDIGPTPERSRMTELAQGLRKGRTYAQIKSDATFRKWMLHGLRYKDAQQWVLNYWLDTYWEPAYAASGGDVRLALVVARIWNTRPKLGQCAADRARKAGNNIQVALDAYVHCPGGDQEYKSRRWGWMKRPVVLFDAYSRSVK